jgi:hypothetical protein
MVSHGKSFGASPFLAAATLCQIVALGMTAAVLLVPGTSFAQVQTSTPPKRRAPRTLPLTKFYDTLHPLPGGKLGELIRSQSFDEYELPFSVSAVRILYHSRSAAGEDVVTSGVVLVPYGKKAPAGGWPVIAWAHGATGVARSCAPSLTRNLGHGPFLAMYVNLGYAVVATDYAGLGTDFRNAFVDGPSNATDLIASIAAARAAVPQLSARWIVMGEAEGSLAAMAVAEKEKEIRDPAYLGSIAISELAGAQEIYGRTASGSSSFTLVSLAYGIKTVYPEFQVSDMLTEKALAVYREIGQTCWEEGESADLSPTETVKPGWTNNPFVRQYFARDSLTQVQTHAPILIITSDGISSNADQSFPATTAAQTVAAMCKQGDSIQWLRYPSLEPGRVIGDSVREQISWIEARFAGRPAPTTCP